MSLILDALKKAQEERKRYQSQTRVAFESISDKGKKGMVIIFVGVVCVVFLAIFLPPFSQKNPVSKPKVTVQEKLIQPTGIPAVEKVQSKEVKTEAAAKTEGDAVSKTKTGAQANLENRAEARPKGERIKSAADTAADNEERMKEALKRMKELKSKEMSESSASAYGKTAPRKERIGKMSEDPPQVIVTKVDEEKLAEMHNEAVSVTEEGRTGEARKLYLQILNEKPHNIEAMNNLGVLAMKEGNTKEALQYFRMILEKNPNYSKAYNNIGILLMQQGDKKLAEEYFKKAADMEKEGVEAYINLSALLRSEKRYNEASKVLEVLVNRHGVDPAVYLSLALIKDEMGKKEEAIKYYRSYLVTGGKKTEKNKVIERLKFLEENQSTKSR